MVKNPTAFAHYLKQKITDRYPVLFPNKRGCFQHYLLTVVLMGLALLLRLAIAPVDAGLQYVTFFPSVTIAALVGGHRAGLLATLIGLVFATYIFTPPYYVFSLDVLRASFWPNLVFLMDGIIVCFSIEALHRYREQSALELNQSKDAELLSRRHKMVIDTAHDGFWVTDLQGNLLEANQAYADMSGYSIDELQNMHISQLEAQENASEVDTHLTHILDQGYDLFETRHRHKDGHEIIFEVSVTYMAESQELFAFFRDITERKKAEEALHIAAVTFEADAAIMVNDADGNILRVNRAFQKITGYSSDEVLGKNPRILSSGQHDETFYSSMWQQLLDNGSWSGEIWDRRKNGQVYPKWLTITVLKNTRDETIGYVAIFKDITERKQAEEEIRNLAFFDPLTKLPNRRLLLDRFQHAQSASERSRLFGAVLFLDMDKFKTINDTLGHDYGDLMLIEVAERINFIVRETDTVARIGGDEFVVLIEEAGETAKDASPKIALIAEKLRSTLSVAYRIQGHEHHSSPSIGVCLFQGNAVSVNDVLKRADIALYQAKNAGRNAVRFYDPLMQQAVETRVALESDLRNAVSNRQLQLYYQIQLDNNRRPLGAEALIRWLHPRRGLVLPAQFIPIAEESGLIVEIGHWVVDQACRQLAEWNKNEQTRQLQLAINVSAHQFRMPNFVESVEAAIRAHGIDASRLKLELTESVILDDVSEIVVKMQALKALGIPLSLDDFGTGYSSLSYLKQLPIDQIKIDQSFVRDIASDPNDAAMVQAIIGMAKNFRLNVIAEGVETEEQLAFLKSNSCMAYQGYLLGKPVPIEQFEALLKCAEYG